MNKIIFNKEQLFFPKKNIFFTCLILFLLFSVQLKDISDEKHGTNFYDFIIQLTDYLTFSYMIVPLFLILLPCCFFEGHFTNYLTFRFKTKYKWYSYYIKLTIFISCLFLSSIIIILLFQSVFLFDLSEFKDSWSFYSQNYYAYFESFLSKTSPLFYILVSFVLMFLQLWVLALLFLNFYIISKNSIFSSIFTFAVYLINLIVIVNKIDNYYPFTFYFHTNIFNYLYLKSETQFTYTIFSFWIVWIIILIVVGLIILQKTDLYFEKEKKV